MAGTAGARTRGGLRLAGVALVGLALGCATVAGTIPERTPLATGTGVFQAGAARVDLTPIPGIPMHGYSTAGAVSRGFWTRLHARALYLEDADGVPLVLVSCDLAMIPNGLADEVARRLASVAPTLPHVGREQLVLAATHTHHGPGNFLTSPLYNTVSPARSGFDPELFEFLAERIADAVRVAHARRVPALLRHKSGAIDGLMENRSLDAFLRNGDEARRFVEGADCGSPTADPSRCVASCQAPIQLVGGVQVPDLDAFAARDFAACAADPRIQLIEIARAANPAELVAAAAFLAVHNTVLLPDFELFAGDLLGVSALLLEETLGTQACAQNVPLMAFFNGAEGDVGPARDVEGQRDRVALLDPTAVAGAPRGRGLALRLARKVCDLLGQPSAASESDPRIAFRFDVVPMGGRRFRTDWDRPPQIERSTAAAARAGAASVGGSEEDGTAVLHELGHHEGLRNFARGEHGAKIPPFQVELMGRRASIAGLVFGTSPPPDEAPIGIYRLGETAFVSLPGEFSTLMGARVRERVAASLQPPPARVLLVGLASGHVSYFATPEEYDAQHYEGANTFFGPAAGPYLACELVRQAEILSLGSPSTCTSVEAPPLPPPAERCWPAPTSGGLITVGQCSSPPRARSFRYDAGSRRVFRPRDAVGPWDPPLTLASLLTGQTTGTVAAEVGSGNYAVAAPVQLPDDGLAAVVQDLTTRFPERRFPTYCWHDAIPRLRDGQCDRVAPLVEIVQRQTISLGAGTVTVDVEVADNRGLDVVTALVAVGSDRSEWCAIWMPPPGQNTTHPYVFRVKGIEASPTEFVFDLAAGPRLRREEVPLEPDLEWSWNPLCQHFPSLCSTVCQDPN